jgi:Resolvase, N terminal domain
MDIFVSHEEILSTPNELFFGAPLNEVQSARRTAGMFDRRRESRCATTNSRIGKQIFTVLGAVAELERSLIAERVKAGLRNARAKGKTLGRPRKHVDAKKIATLRSQGLGWRAVAKELRGLESELSIASLLSVPKFRKGFLERGRWSSRALNG